MPRRSFPSSGIVFALVMCLLLCNTPCVLAREYYADSFQNVKAIPGNNNVVTIGPRNENDRIRDLVDINSERRAVVIESIESFFLAFILLIVHAIVDDVDPENYKNALIRANAVVMGEIPVNRYTAMTHVAQYITDKATPSRKHGIQYDSVIMSSSKGEKCEFKDGFELENCNFNEIFICYQLAPGNPEWHGFNLSPPQEYGGYQDSMHRNAQKSPWKVQDWTIVETRNRHVKIILRFGKGRGQSCTTGEGNENDVHMVWAHHEVKNNKAGLMTSDSYQLGGKTITCIKIEPLPESTVGMVTCDHVRYSEDGETFITETSGLAGHNPNVVALPCRVSLLVDNRNTITPVKIGKSMQLAPDMGTCLPGYYYSKWTNQRGGKYESCERLVDCGKSIAQCTEIQIRLDCGAPNGPLIHKNPRQAETIFNCIQTHREQCYKDAKIQPFHGNNECKLASDHCKSGRFLDMEQFVDDLSDKNSVCRTTLDCGCKSCVVAQTTIPGQAKPVLENCAGAFAGNFACDGQPSVKTHRDLRHEDTTYLWIDPSGNDEAECKPCVQCSPGSYVTGECGNNFNELPGVGALQIECAPCQAYTCAAGYYRRCLLRQPGGQLWGTQLFNETERQGCDRCFCGSLENPGCGNPAGFFCLVDHTICHGNKFENDGATCRDHEDVHCPAGKKRVNLDNTTFMGELIKFTLVVSDISQMVDTLCVDCQHPGTFKANGGKTMCDTGLFWPNCSAGTKHGGEPQCQNCADPPNNAHHFQNQFSINECEWRCNVHFFRLGDECVSCRVNDDQTALCQIGKRALMCDVGSSYVSCTPCTKLSPNCVDDTGLSSDAVAGSYRYEQQCNGRGYIPDEDIYLLNDPRKNQCQTCNGSPPDGVACNTSFYWSVCGQSLPYSPLNSVFASDPSKCKPCTTTADNAAPSNSVWSLPSDTNGGGGCDFDCFPSFYKEPSIVNDFGDVSRQAFCASCASLALICGCEDCSDEAASSGEATGECHDCSGVTYSGCSTSGMVSRPTCSCKAGYQNRNENNNAAEVICEICTNYEYSLAGGQCLTCPGGYMGTSILGATGCIPCPVNTFRPHQVTTDERATLTLINPMTSCQHCPAGTDGLRGSQICVDCKNQGGKNRGNGLKANLMAWNELVFNYETGTYISLNGIIPTRCDVQGTSSSVRICDAAMNINTMKWTRNDILQYQGTIGTLQPTFECGSCDGGLAYSGTFDYKQAFEWAF